MAQEKSEHITRGVILRTHRSGKQTISIRFTFKGMRCTEPLKVSPNESGKRYAQRLVGEIENAIERKTFNYQDYFPDSPRSVMFGHSVSNETVEQAIGAWLEDVERSLRHSTFNTYRKRASKIIIKIGKLRKRDITGAVIRDLVREWGSESLKTIRNNLIPLRAVMDQAVIDREIQHNPADGLKVAKLITRRAKATSVDPFEYDELQAIIDSALELYGPGFRNFVGFSFYQGLRTGEMYGLQWQDVDWRRNAVAIRRSIVHRRMQDEVKTAAGEREVDLTIGGYLALKAQQAITGFKGDHIFCRPSGKPFKDYEETAAPFRRILKALGIRHRQQYQARHTFASMKLSHGENLFYVAKQMGHADAQMLLKVYGRYIESAKERVELPLEFQLKGSAEGPRQSVVRPNA